jgi:hypothetical protein
VEKQDITGAESLRDYLVSKAEEMQGPLDELGVLNGDGELDETALDALDEETRQGACCNYAAMVTYQDAVAAYDVAAEASSSEIEDLDLDDVGGDDEEYSEEYYDEGAPIL